MNINPYSPPISAAEETDNLGVERRLRRAAKLFRWMGWTGIAYSLVAYTIGLSKEIYDTPVRVGATISMSVFALVLLLLFSSMLWLAPRIRTDLKSIYAQARWTGILVGALTFPILTFPAFYAVRLIGIANSANDKAVVDEATAKDA